MSVKAERSAATSARVGVVTATARSPRRRRWVRIPYSLKAKLAVGAVLLVAWEAGIRLFAPHYVARPTEIVPVIPGVLTSGDFIAAFWGTMVPIVQGLVIAVAAATVVGLAMGQVRWLEWSLRAYTNALFALPMVAIVPLMTMWLGYNESARLAIIIFAAYFPMVINVYDGSRATPKTYLEVAASYRASRRSVWFGVVLPSAIPYLLAGFRLASGRALIGAVVAEYLISINGLGFFILVNARTFRHNEAFVGVITLALLGVGALALVRWATRRLAPWYEAERS